MTIDIFTKTPQKLISTIINSCRTPSGDWQVIDYDEKVYLTLVDDKYYFKMIIDFKECDGVKVRASAMCFKDDLPTEKVMAQYSGRLVEYLVENFSDSFQGIQISL